MSKLKITLFGRFCAQLDDVTLTGFEAYKVQELLCYLLLRRDRPHARETLAGTLWGEASVTQSKKYLRQAVWQLQSAVNNRRLLTVEPDWIKLDSGTDLFLDVAVFEEAFSSAHGTPGRELDERKILALRQAVKLYDGDLLEGWYQDWCLYERERLQNLYLAMLDKLMDYCEANEQYDDGFVYGASILRLDRARERTHRQLMRMQCVAGNRTAALRQYERCAAALREELGVKPEKRTSLLYEQIRNEQFVSLETNPHQTNPHQTDPPSQATMISLPEALKHLKRLMGVLGDIQKQVQQDIQAVELTLGKDS